jgi:hypothetical protein
MNRAVRSRIARALRQALAALALLSFGLGLAEAALQLIARTIPAARDRLSGGHPRYVLDSRLGARGDAILTSEFDAYGFRNVERPRQADLVALGDSQTEGAGVARKDAWPEQLGRSTGLRVYQMAFGGYGPGHYAVLSEDARALQPRAVVIGLYFGNDFADAYRWVYESGRGQNLRSQDPRLLASLEAARERPPVNESWHFTRDVALGIGGSPFLRWLIRDGLPEMKLFQLGGRLIAALNAPGESPDPQWEAVLGKVRGAEPDLLFPFEHGPLRTVLTPGARLAAEAPGDPRIEAGVRVALASARFVQRRCAPARVAVMLIPTKELVFARAVSASGAHEPAALRALVARESALRESLRADLESSGILVIDPLPRLQRELDAGRNPYRIDWDGHPNPLGLGVIASVVADSGVLAGIGSR